MNDTFYIFMNSIYILKNIIMCVMCIMCIYVITHMICLMFMISTVLFLHHVSICLPSLTDNISIHPDISGPDAIKRHKKVSEMGSVGNCHDRRLTWIESNQHSATFLILQLNFLQIFLLRPEPLNIICVHTDIRHSLETAWYWITAGLFSPTLWSKHCKNQSCKLKHREKYTVSVRY